MGRNAKRHAASGNRAEDPNHPPTPEDGTADSDKTALWTKPQEAFLLRLLLERHTKMSGNGWPKAVWIEVAAAVNAEFPDAPGLPKDFDKCKNKFQKLKQDYKDVVKLRGLSGFGWDPDQCLVTAPEDVWAPYLQAHPSAKTWKKTPFPLYDDFAQLQGDVIATGSRALALGMSLPPDSDEDAVADSNNASGASGDEEEVPAKRHPHDPLDATQGKVGKRPKRASQVDGLLAMSHAVDHVGESIALALAPARPALPPSPVRITQAIALMEKDGDLSDDDLVAAAELFELNTRKADVFLSFETKRHRAKWLIKQLHKSD